MFASTLPSEAHCVVRGASCVAATFHKSFHGFFVPLSSRFLLALEYVWPLISVSLLPDYSLLHTSLFVTVHVVSSVVCLCGKATHHGSIITFCGSKDTSRWIALKGCLRNFLYLPLIDVLCSNLWSAISKQCLQMKLHFGCFQIILYNPIGELFLTDRVSYFELVVCLESHNMKDLINKI